MSSKIVVLGAGMVGKAMAIDLAKKHDVTSIDVSQEALDYLKNNYKIKTINANLRKTEDLAGLVKDFDLVVCAVPGFMGFETIKAVIKAGKNIVDISFHPEDSLELDALAKEVGVTVMTDIGVAPGIPNILAGYYSEKMKITDFEYMVGGLPKTRKFPFEYKAPFSPCDVIEEYTRPARYVENSVMVTKPAMSDPELLHFDGVGTLEAFNTDGLRSLIKTLPGIPNMKEKTLRFPGHIKLIQALQTVGFFNHEEIDVKGQKVSPFDFTSKLLFKEWKLGAEEPEFTIMRIKINGTDNATGKKKEIVYDLYDEYDPREKISSMARTTGFTATAGVDLFLSGTFTEKGLFPPELVGKHAKCYDSVLRHLKERNIVMKRVETDL